MGIQNKILSGFLILGFSFSAWSASVSLGKIIAEGLTAEGKEALTKMGLGAAAQSELMKSLDIAVSALNKGTKPASEEALKKLFAGQPALAAVLGKNMDQLTTKELADFNAALAGRANSLKIGQAYVAASSCLDPELVKIGIHMISREVGDSTGKILAAAPKDRALQSAISAFLRKLKIAGVNDEALSLLRDHEKKLLYAALKKTAEGSKEEKALGEAIKKFSASNNESYLEPKMWLLMTEELGTSDMERMASLINRVSAEAPASEADRIKNLRDWFESNADTDELKLALNNLKEKNCWGIFK